MNFLVTGCDNVIFKYLLYPVKGILNLLMIICPILAIISLTIIIIKMITNPEEKKIIKKLQNSIFALIIVFFIPVIVNAVMGILDNDYNISKCWNNVEKNSGISQYISPGGKEEEKKSVLIDPSAYEKGVPKQLKFDYDGNGTVKSQFSTETMKIVESHLNDFNYYNFKSFMASQGGVGNYVKSLGGVFNKYYGGNKTVNSVYEFQQVSEYVFGLMYIYGFDYYNGSKYCKWGGSCSSGSSGSSDAFYPGTLTHTSDGLSNNKDFDKLISGTDEINMTTNCNWTVDMVYNKAGIYSGTKGASYSTGCSTVIKNITDLKVGDLIHFFNSSINLDASPSSWRNSGWYHVAYVGEVYDDRVVFYDGGSYFTNGRNFKWEVKRDNSIKKLHGSSNWAACRIVNLE